MAMHAPVRSPHLTVLQTPQQRAEEAAIEQLAALDEFADAAETAYALLAEIATSRLSRKVIELNFHRATSIVNRAGIRARAAAEEYRSLGGPDVA